MENSFVDYRDQSVTEDESDTEVIDNSLVVDESLKTKKKHTVKNHTIFVAESEESTSEDDNKEEYIERLRRTVARKISAQSITSLSSDNDTSEKHNSTRQSDKSPRKVVISSSDEEEMSPEMVPKRRPQIKAVARVSEPFIGRKTKKRIMVLDSDTDNSFILEQERRGKLTCLKDTPVKIDIDKVKPKPVNRSFDEKDDGTDDISETDDKDADTNDSARENQEYVSDSDDRHERGKKKDSVASNDNDSDAEYSNSNPDDDNPGLQDEEDDDGPDEDQMVLSRATRMSIMGFLPKENDSDDSDYIQTDTSKTSSRGNSTVLPETSVTGTPEKANAVDKLSELSKLPTINADKLEEIPTLSPVQVLQDITNDIRLLRKSLNLKNNRKSDVIESSIEGHREARSLGELNTIPAYTEKVIDDDVTIIDRPPEIIALSSDDEDVVEISKKSPNMKKNRKSDVIDHKLDSNIKQYLVPASYPNQVVYVEKKVRESELAKLNGLKEELQNIRYLLEHMEMETLPDGGVKLIERLSALEGEVRRQGDKVAAMVVEPNELKLEDPSLERSGKADRTPTWDDIQKASDAVQPRMFGKHAMATHMAERHQIMERLRDLHESLASRPAERAHAAPPAALRTQLMPHQLHALAWLRWRETQRPPGGILADDMGLGKTITMIALVALDKENGIDDGEDDDGYTSKTKAVRGGTLVVCPASLMQQWAGEVRAHCAPHALSVTLHHGAARAQHAHRLAASDLVLTTYNILQRETEKSGVLTKVRWRRVILDEAHVVRNHKSATSGAVWALRARRRWALTGTPLHNKDLDLFALLKFLHCSPFDDLTMWKKWIDNKSLGGEERLSMIMRCLMLRRTKALLQAGGQLACLPERTAHELRVTLSKDEMNVYQKMLVSSKTLFAQYLHQRAEKQAGADGLTRFERDNAYALHKKMASLQGVKLVKSHEILVLLLRLRQICCHCGLIAAMLNEDDADVQEDAGGRDLLDELNKLSLEDSRSRRKSGGRDVDKEGEESEGEGQGEGEGATVAEAIRSVLSVNNPVFSLERPSAKISAVMDCLNTNVFTNKGEKAVVVSQWTSVLRLVERQLRAGGVRCVTLSGAVPVAARPALVAALNDARSDVRVMLLSLCAGGVGLNLCGANHLLLLDPHWNPQLEQQAQDRVYRVGQNRPVHIYRFLCADTVEQSINKLQQSKLELADNVLTGARNTNASKLTIDDLKMLFNMGPADTD